MCVTRYRLPRFRGSGKNQRVGTFWRHKSIKNRSIIAQIDSDLWSIQKLEQYLMILQKSVFKYLDFLGKCTNVVFSVKPRKGDGWSGNCNKCFRSILPYSFYMQSAPHAFFAGIELQHVAWSFESDLPFLNFLQLIHSSSSISWPSLKFLAVIVFGISWLQIFKVQICKGR